MKTKKKVGILFGGQSAEHEVSLKSTLALFTHMDKEKYDPILIYISRDGKWRVIDSRCFLEKSYRSLPGHPFLPWQMMEKHSLDVDIYFPMLHGPNGEDGRIQAMLELAGKPFAGADSFSSALAMDKVVAKLLFQKAGLNVADSLFFETDDYNTVKEAVSRHLDYPLFVKPSALGSSVGITKVKEEKDLKKAIDLAFQYDRKVLVEKAVDMREIEISVMGNRDIMVSRPGELIPSNEFYDYNDKYVDGKTTFFMPAQLDPQVEEDLRKTAGLAYKALFLNGMSRVDLFLEKQTGRIYVNEINTIPGFTEISMFPKLWSLQGISFTGLISRLIDYGFEYWEEHHISTVLHEGIKEFK